MQNNHSTETGRRSRSASAREKKAMSSGMLLATGAFLIVVCVILYSIYSSNKGSGGKALEAEQPSANGQAADNGAGAPQDSTQDGGSNAAGNADSPDAGDSSNSGDSAAAGGTADGAGNTAADTGGNDGGGDAGTAAPDTANAPDKPAADEPAKSDSAGTTEASSPEGATADAGTKAPVSISQSDSKLPTSYVVRKGDTLSTISMKFYHSKQYVAFLAERNGIVFVNDMKVGDTIKIPALTANAGSDSGKQADADYSKVKLPATYLVRPGDTLYRISVLFYQSGEYAGFLAKQNDLDENAGLKAGASLAIPAKPSTK